MSSQIHPVLKRYLSYMLKQYRENKEFMEKTQHTIMGWIKDNNLTNEEASKRIHDEMMHILDHTQGVTTEEYHNIKAVIDFVAAALKTSHIEP